MEILELNAISKIKILTGHTYGWEWTWQSRVSELDNRSIEIIQGEEQTEKWLEKKMNRMLVSCENIKQSNIQKNGKLERK